MPRRTETSPDNNGMIIEAIPIELLSADPANARRHPERNIEAIKASLRRFGQQKPIVVGKDGLVVAGNGTLEAAKSLAWKTVNAVRTKLTGAEAVAYGIADNRTGELAMWDDTKLGALIRSFGEIGPNDLPGFSAAELGRFSIHKSSKAPEGSTDESADDRIVERLVIANCSDEPEQQRVYQTITTMGIKCRVSTLY